MCDLFDVQLDDLNGIGPADCVFDRAAFVAVPKCDRRRYADKVTSLCRPDAYNYLMITEVYDDQKYDIGPPFCANMQDLQASFEGKFYFNQQLVMLLNLYVPLGRP